jgi:hypothetical protein
MWSAAMVSRLTMVRVLRPTAQSCVHTCIWRCPGAGRLSPGCGNPATQPVASDCAKFTQSPSPSWGLSLLLHPRRLLGHGAVVLRLQAHMFCSQATPKSISTLLGVPWVEQVHSERLGLVGAAALPCGDSPGPPGVGNEALQGKSSFCPSSW